jgi:hypothetical protein
MISQTKTMLAAALLAAAAIASSAAIADEPAAADTGKLKSGLSSTAQLLQLMDTDKNGKVSKAEFMRFMEAEFDWADKNKDGELDPKELRHLQYALTHPTKGPGR